jgi:N-acetylmuramate 1-kinase
MTAVAAGHPLEDRVEAIARRTWPGARLRGLDLLAGDASARRYARLALAGGRAPATVVAMILPETGAAASEELTGQVAASPELPFVSVGRFLAASGIPVPAILADATAEGFLLLEDVGDTTLAAVAASGDGSATDRLVEATDTLAAIAALIRRPDPACCAFAQRYDRELIGRELALVDSHGLAPSDDGPARDPGSDPEVARALARLGDRIAAMPDVLMHRDYHAWNLHVDPAGRLCVIDFQDALVGPALYDLASLCTDRDSHRFVSPSVERTLVDRFARGLAGRAGPKLGTGDRLMEHYFEAVAYRTLRVIGRFRFLAIVKGKAGYLRFVPAMARQTRRALEAIDDRRLLGALAARAAVFS